MTGLTEDDLKSLIRSLKPAFTAAGMSNDPNRDPTFKVIYNGRGAWMVERPTQTELLAGERTVLLRADAVDVIDMPVAVNNDVKIALDGRRIAYLEEGHARDHWDHLRCWASLPSGPSLGVEAGAGRTIRVGSRHGHRRHLANVLRRWASL